MIVGRENDDFMNDKSTSIWRKHGRHAGLRVVNETAERHDKAQPARLKTSLTFESAHQAYCWSTDRGRSRLIKH
jgi:hypothetical protein